MRSANRLLATGLATGVAFFAGTPRAASAESSPAAQRQYIKSHLQSGEKFGGRFLEAPLSNAEIFVRNTKRPDEFMVNPLVIERAGHIVSYVARMGESSLKTLSAHRSQVAEYIGHHAIPIDQPEDIVARRVIEATPYTDDGVVGFTDGYGGSFGLLP